MMRGDFDYPGNAPQYRLFAREFFDHIGLSENDALRLRLSR